MPQTRDETKNYGRNLNNFLQQEWDRLGTNRGAWCFKHKLPDSTVFRWSQGTEPQIGLMIQVAAALGRPLTDVLVGAGYMESDAELPTVQRAIQTDPTISEFERIALRQVHDAFSLASMHKEDVRKQRRTRQQRNEDDAA